MRGAVATANSHLLGILLLKRGMEAAAAARGGGNGAGAGTSPAPSTHDDPPAGLYGPPAGRSLGINAGSGLTSRSVRRTDATTSRRSRARRRRSAQARRRSRCGHWHTSNGARRMKQELPASLWHAGQGTEYGPTSGAVTSRRPPGPRPGRRRSPGSWTARSASPPRRRPRGPHAGSGRSPASGFPPTSPARAPPRAPPALPSPPWTPWPWLHLRSHVYRTR